MSQLTPLERYQLALERDELVADPIQIVALGKLDVVFRAVLTPLPRTPSLLRFMRPKAGPAIRGLYLWGGVGRGKTFVVDAFFACLPDNFGRRVHFHSFMQDIHRELKNLSGIANPLQHLARRWATQLRVLCLDEFHIVDITDAMLLAQLLSAMFSQGIILVTTSNEAPDLLYRGGLQRDRFLPAIALLKSHLEIFEFSGVIDYRLRTLTQAATYYTPNDDTAECALQARYFALTHTCDVASSLIIESRSLATRGQVDGIVWFEFDVLCGGPRATADYIEIGCCFHTVFVSNIPCFSDDDNDAARRFINLIDEFYDRGVNVLCSAATNPAGLYRGSRLLAPFARTTSRLMEMQSEEYLAKPHLSD
ncbi:MAG: cell division protein ZapE [Gammaproteobacteria bacterium]|nr:cell division protein ZapE [Gammaproteobacteria bacterium]